MENNPSKDSYLSIDSASEGLFKDNGSRFIALAYPVETESEIKDIVASLKKEYHDARHHCYAYRLGYKGDVFRANDDGEPSSSAGRPILGQIDANGLSDILIVVVRYFGGIKLGIPGLIQDIHSRCNRKRKHHRKNSKQKIPPAFRIPQYERCHENGKRTIPDTFQTGV